MLPKSGRYYPTHGDPKRLELRVELFGGLADTEEAGVLSGDLILDDQSLHSFISFPRDGGLATELVQQDGPDEPVRLNADVRFGPDNFREGEWGKMNLEFDSNREAQLHLTCPSLTIDETVHVRWKDRYYRALTIELDKIAESDFPAEAMHHGHLWSLGDIFRMAGFRTRLIRSHRRIEDDPTGWSVGELHEAMSLNRRLNLPPWSTYVYVTSLFEDDWGPEPGVMGIMFDWGDETPDAVPREGCAVFVQGILDYVNAGAGPDAPDSFQRELLMTIAHEIGHTFNLLHSFEFEKGRPDSPSLMNYPEEYDFGIEAYYEDMNFSFDGWELTHLRHHSPVVTEPGRADGTDFGRDVFREAPGTVQHLRTARSAESAYRDNFRMALRDANQRSKAALRLNIELPAKEFLLDEPIVGEISLLKHDPGQISFMTNLDWSSGRLVLQARRSGEPRWITYHYPIRLCRRPRAYTLKSGQQIVSSVPIVLSREGVLFPNSGEYEVKAKLTVKYKGKFCDVSSRPKKIRVVEPQTPDERALVGLFRFPDLKKFLLMPGAALDPRARLAAEEIHERARDGLPGQLAAVALIRESQSYRLGHVSRASRNFVDRDRVRDTLNRIHEDPIASRMLRGSLRGISRREEGLKR